ncbi:hypothetical protein CsSME_00015235 [Camellia sinensis var. sinensis]
MNNQDDMANNQELNRKRKNSHDFQIPITKFPDIHQEDDESTDFSLSLSLSFHPPTPHRPPRLPQPPPPPPPPPPQSPPLHSLLSHPPPQLPLQLPPSHPLFIPPPSPAGPSRPLRARRNPTQAPREGKSDIVPSPFPWATNRRATVHSLDHLISNQIFTIVGYVQCKRCERSYELEFDLRQKFLEVGTFIADHKATMHDRAPAIWMNPNLPSCKFCQQEHSMKPIIAEKKKSINWLFLLLGQMLGCCTLEQLKYFCKHTKNHRTGAKDRVLYLTYLGLCKQLDPNGPVLEVV